LLVLLAALAVSGVRTAARVRAQEAGNIRSAEAVVTDIVDQGEREAVGEAIVFQTLRLRYVDGPRSGQTVNVTTQDTASAGTRLYAVGDHVMLAEQSGVPADATYFIEDRVRRTPLAGLLAVFVAVVLVVARRRGLASLLSLVLSFAAIFLFMLPLIASGNDPIVVAIVTSLFIIPSTYYLSHGLNRKTHAAVVGTLVALLITGLLAVVAVDAAAISGYASEEASYVQNLRPGIVNIRGLLLASILIGLSGILDDITISQAAIVAQLRSAAADMSVREVYGRAMDVGHDHIASLVNTLILVYASSALPLLLLFRYGDVPWRDVVNFEVVAEEIVRTLVASIGLVLAVPVTTLIACLMLRSGDAVDQDQQHVHVPGPHSHVD